MIINKPAYVNIQPKMYPRNFLGRYPMAKQWARLSDETLIRHRKAPPFGGDFSALQIKNAASLN